MPSNAGFAWTREKLGCLKRRRCLNLACRMQRRTSLKARFCEHVSALVVVGAQVQGLQPKTMVGSGTLNFRRLRHYAESAPHMYGFSWATYTRRPPQIKITMNKRVHVYIHIICVYI